jgi:hypothetical protein
MIAHNVASLNPKPQTSSIFVARPILDAAKLWGIISYYRDEYIFATHGSKWGSRNLKLNHLDIFTFSTFEHFAHRYHCSPVHDITWRKMILGNRAMSI